MTANKKELEMLARLPRSSGLSLLWEESHRRMPYAASSRGWLCDAIWLPPAKGVYQGICIEIQGMGNHSRITGMSRDCKKASIAQKARWMWFGLTYMERDFDYLASQLADMAAVIIDVNGRYSVDAVSDDDDVMFDV